MDSLAILTGTRAWSLKTSLTWSSEVVWTFPGCQTPYISPKSTSFSPRRTGGTWVISDFRRRCSDPSSANLWTYWVGINNDIVRIKHAKILRDALQSSSAEDHTYRWKLLSEPEATLRRIHSERLSFRVSLNVPEIESLDALSFRSANQKRELFSDWPRRQVFCVRYATTVIKVGDEWWYASFEWNMHKTCESASL